MASRRNMVVNLIGLCHMKKRFSTLLLRKLNNLSIILKILNFFDTFAYLLPQLYLKYFVAHQ